MLTVAEIIQIERAKAAKGRPSNEELRQVPLDRPARLLGRLSSPPQIHESIQSMSEFVDLVKLARGDGITIELSDEEAEQLVSVIQSGDRDAPRYWKGAYFIIDLRDLGLSGRLGPDKRPTLAELMADLSRGEAPDVTGTIYLSSEGVSRLSRDQDRVVGYQLLKLMKAANCRVRTPYATLNPKIEADWKELAEGFEDAARESKHLQEKHFGPKKRDKAKKGEHVGSQVPPGFIIEIKGYKSSGSYIFGKWLPYLPHAETVVKILREYVRCNGSKYRAAQALRGTFIPPFPGELKYMETRSSLRNCLKTDEGYIITPEVIDGLAQQVALIGTWKWSDIMIENNHPAIVPVDLFGEAYELANRRGGKPRGRAAYYEPLDWDGLLWCLNHETPRRISGHSSNGTWVCDRDYHNGTGPICLKINHRIISEPLAREFLKCLDLSSHATAVFDEVQNRAMATDDEQARRKREETQLRNRLINLENYLGSSDPELEENYRRQIKQVKAELRSLQQKPLPLPVTIADINRVRHFLENLENEWQKLSPSLRNRLLKLLVDRVEIVHDPHRIQATIIWKIGFKQKIDIERPVGNSRQDRRWTSEQDGLLRMLWPTSTKEVLLAAFPDRGWRGIQSRAVKLGLKRQVRHYPPHWKPWTPEDDAMLAELYVKESSAEVIASELGRSIQSVAGRACLLKIGKPREVRFPKPKPAWEVQNFYGLETVCSFLPPSPVFSDGRST